MLILIFKSMIQVQSIMSRSQKKEQLLYNSMMKSMKIMNLQIINTPLPDIQLFKPIRPDCAKEPNQNKKWTSMSKRDQRLISQKNKPNQFMVNLIVLKK